MIKPDNEELCIAEDTCWYLAKYIEEKWPYATNEISTLRAAADVLAAHNSDDSDEDGWEDDENGESPTTEN